MAINFPNSPTNGQAFDVGAMTFEYNSTKARWEIVAGTTNTDISDLTDTTNVIPDDISDLTDTGGLLGTGGATVYADMAALIAATGMSNGDFALVAANNNIYVYNGAGWYKIATVQNDSPSAITGVNGTYELAIDGTATTITAVSTDPEGFPLTWSYSASGLGNIATVSNTDNVFTITPSTTEADAGTFTLTINATDGINGAVSTSTSLTLEFIITVTNSRYTTLLATATPKNTTVYRYFKFLPQAMRSATPDAMQYSEFELTDGTSYYSPSSASQLYRADDTDGDNYVAGQNVAASIDGNTSTKLYNGGWASKYYLYDMGSSFSTALTGWRYKTGNDMDSRDPVSWTLLGSTNNTDWVILDQRTQETITTSRQTATQDFTFNATNQAVFDAANTNYPIEVNGDAHAGTFSPYRSGGYSMFFNNNTETSQIKYSENTNFNMGTNAFTIEGWIRPNDTATGSRRFYQNRYSGTGNGRGSIFQSGSNLYMSYRGDDGTDYELGPYSVLSVNTWTHFCLLRNTSDNTLKLYADGILLGSIAVPSSVGIYNSTSNTYIGVGFRGDMANIRVVNGTAITPSSNSIAKAPENVTNTILLLNEGSVTNYSSVSMPYEAVYLPTIKPYGPLNYSEYSATDHGGSVYFDGTGDYLTLATTPTIGNSDFEISMWLWPETISGDDVIIDFRPSSTNGTYINLFMTNGVPILHVNGNQITGSSALSTETWSYLTLTRVSGSTKLYVNGTQTGSTYSDTNNYLTGSSRPTIGQAGYNPSLNLGFNGYMSDLVVKLSGNSSPSIPTAPVSSSGTSLHIKGTDASIIDKSQGTNLKLVGNTTGSTTQVKFADTKSMYFDGTGDGIVVPHNDNLNLNSCDWTIEYWFNVTNPGAIANWTFLQKGDNTTVRPYAISFRLDNNNGVEPRIFPSADNSTQGQISNNAWQTFNAWHHVAFVRVNSTGVITRYINGIANGTVTSDIATNTEDLYIGNVPSAADEEGYIQDLRITKGLARYTAADETSNIPSAPLEG